LIEREPDDDEGGDNSTINALILNICIHIMNREEAFRVLKLDPQTATNSDVEKMFRELLHKAHPDKGGTNEQLLALQSARAVALGQQQNSFGFAASAHSAHVSSKSFPKHLKLMIGSLVLVVVGINIAKRTAAERKIDRSPRIRAALGLEK
jgi:hypothetical protein